MHWDGSVSIGNVLTGATALAWILIALSRYASSHKVESATTAAAINNLAAITQDLRKEVQTQNGRLARVETTLAVREEVDKRMAALQHPQA